MRKVGLYLMVLLLACGASWFFATRMESPDQAAARAQPPEPVPVTAELQHGFLHPPVTMATTAAFEHTRSVRLPSEVQGVVTAVDADPGTALAAGDAPLRVNGRPVFVLPGSFALYRDLREGDEGDDALAVQDGLRAAGFTVQRDRPGVFGTGTLQALTRMYRAAGYAPPTTEQQSAAPAPTDAVRGDSPAAADIGPGAQAAPVHVLRRAEIVMVDALPAVVEAISAVGASVTADTELLRLGSGAVVLTAQVPAGSLGALTIGASGSLVAADGAPSVGQVVGIDPVPQTESVAVRVHAPVALTPGGAYVLAFDNPAGETGERLLAPVAAVVDRGGRAYVYVREGDRFDEVEVTVEDSVGGLAAIIVADPTQALAAGTAVRVGEDRTASG